MRGVGSGGVLYLLLTNEPSNHKEWARRETEEGAKRGEERERVRQEEMYGSGRKNSGGGQ